MISSARTDVKDKDGRLPRDLARDRDIKDLFPTPEGTFSSYFSVVPTGGDDDEDTSDDDAAQCTHTRVYDPRVRADNEDAWDLGDSDSD